MNDPKHNHVNPSLSHSVIKNGIWAYFFLLIFEGALRKWLVPSLATPILIIRDPIALWMLFEAWKRNLLPSNVYIIASVFIGIGSVITSVFSGSGKFFIAIYGARILLIHFPVIFLIGRIFDKKDVMKMGIALLWISLPMTLLITLQFYSPQSAFVNRGIGGDITGAGFSGALGYFRPPGTFSFTNGNTLFYSLVAPFVFYFWLHPKKINYWLLFGSTAALLAAIPLSISRGLFFQVGLSFLFTAVAISRKPEYLGRMLFAVAGIAVSFLILSNGAFFKTSTEAFFSRFDAASEAEGGLQGTFGDRFLGGLISALASSFDQPFFGSGSGTGTLAGSALTNGNREFLVAEGEWGRVIGEVGPVMGLTLVFVRFGLALKLGIASYHKLVRGNMLPWILGSFGFITLAQGGWAQPTALGFCILIGGLVIASFREPAE